MFIETIKPETSSNGDNEISSILDLFSKIESLLRGIKVIIYF